MKSKSPLCFILFFITTAVFSFTVIKLIQKNEALKGMIPYPIEGERIEYFDLMGMDEKNIGASVLEGDGTSLIFIFSRPCSPCNRNVAFWDRMAKILKEKVKVYGIIPGQFGGAHDFSTAKKLSFKIFVPTDLSLFLKKMRLKLNLAQTILYQGNEVKMTRIGDLEGEDYTAILRRAKKLARRSVGNRK